MADAHVRDLEALELFLIQLRDFQERLCKLQEDSRTEMNRVTQWIEQEAPGYWQDQERNAKRRWVEARDALARCQSVTRAEDHPSCMEHRKRVEKWTLRVKLCERQNRQVRQAQLAWNQELQGLLLKLQHLSDVVESKLPLARHHLDSLLDPLRKYANLSSGANKEATKYTTVQASTESSPSSETNKLHPGQGEES